MNAVILVSAVLLACLCVPSDAYRRRQQGDYVIRRGARKPVPSFRRPEPRRQSTVYIINQDTQRTAQAAAPPTAPAPAPEQSAHARVVSPPSRSGGVDYRTLSHHLMMMDLYDMPFVPYMGQAGRGGPSSGAYPGAYPGKLTHDLLLADTLDVPYHMIADPGSMGHPIY